MIAPPPSRSWKKSHQAVLTGVERPDDAGVAKGRAHVKATHFCSARIEARKRRAADHNFTLQYQHITSARSLIGCGQCAQADFHLVTASVLVDSGYNIPERGREWWEYLRKT